MRIQNSRTPRSPRLSAPPDHQKFTPSRAGSSFLPFPVRGLGTAPPPHHHPRAARTRGARASSCPQACGSAGCRDSGRGDGPDPEPQSRKGSREAPGRSRGPTRGWVRRGRESRAASPPQSDRRSSDPGMDGHNTERPGSDARRLLGTRATDGDRRGPNPKAGRPGAIRIGVRLRASVRAHACAP